EVVISEGLKIIPGGKATNAAIGMARLGQSVYFIGKIGNDSFGQEIHSIFQQENLHTEFVDTDAFIPTGTVMVNVDAQGKNTIIVNEDANIRINRQSLVDMFGKIDSRELSIQCLYLTLEPLPDIVEFAIREASKRDIMVFCDAAPQARPLDRSLYPYIHFLTANEFEVSSMTKTHVVDVESAKSAALFLRKQGARHIIVTLGALGAVSLPEGSVDAVYTPGRKVRVVDETAAGDAFRAAYVSEYLLHKDSVKAVAFANLVGAYAVTKLGSYSALPKREELAFLETFDKD
ncbi:MAG: PfkB family carbohydrate kinase, partial [bacterium]|nr:PfkB family carbohydrate kinase [bacterium]